MAAFTKANLTRAINRSGMSTAEKKAVQGIVDSVPASFWGTSQSSALTTALTTLTNAGTASDYAIQAMTSTSPFGFASQAEGETVVDVVLNNQARINEIETALQAFGILA